MPTGPSPMEVTIQQSLGRSKPTSYLLQSTTMLDLLLEAVELAKILATEERDLLAIRSDYELRTAKLANSHALNVLSINHEYESRKIQMETFHRVVEKMMESGEFAPAQQLMNRLADILAMSPLDKILTKR